MNQQVPQKLKRVVPTASRIFPDGTILELVYSPKERKTLLAAFRNGSVSYEKSVEVPSGESLIPLSAENNLVRHEVLLLPEKSEDFGTVADLMKEIDAHLYRYVDLSDNFRRIAAYYILLTWVYDAFNELPYLRLRGEFGTGKSRALLVIGSVCYKAFIASGASTVSPIFHILDSFRGTLVLDEADFRFSDEKAELSKILNNGNIKGFPVLRTMVTPQKEFDPRAFNVFGPKLVAMRRGFDDTALESRFITEEMGERTLRADIPINLPDEQKDEARALRNKLLAYRFHYRARIKVNPSLRNPALSPRLNQILVPLLSIVEDEHLRAEIQSVAKGLEAELTAEREATTEAQLLDVLMSLRNGREGIPVGEITSSFIERYGAEYDRPITNRFIGSLLRRRLHLKTYKTNGVYVLSLVDEEKLRMLCVRYGVAWKGLDTGPICHPVMRKRRRQRCLGITRWILRGKAGKTKKRQINLARAFQWT